MRIIVMLLAAAFVASCTMVDSTLIKSFNSNEPYGIGCRSDSGAYYLSKTFFDIRIDRVIRDDDEVDVPHYEFAFFHLNRKPDKREGYCLDYLASPTAEEKVKVTLSPNYLLRYISTESIDQSGYIIKAGIKAVFRGLGGLKGNSGLRKEAASVPVLEAEFDPFDRVEAARMNHAMAKFGFCVIVERQTFDLDRMTVRQYCDDPFKAVRQDRANLYPRTSAPPPKNFASKGILYRPRVPYKVYLFIRKDPDNRSSAWNLDKVGSVMMENDSPVISVGVERAFFAARKATLVFDEGQLGNICVHKTSELLEISTIPLELAKSIAALPTEILQLRIDNSNNYRALVETETELIDAQRARIEKAKHSDEAGQREFPGDKREKRAAAIGDVARLANPYTGAENEIVKNFTAICPKPQKITSANLGLGSAPNNVLSGANPLDN